MPLRQQPLLHWRCSLLCTGLQLERQSVSTVLQLCPTLSTLFPLHSSMSTYSRRSSRPATASNTAATDAFAAAAQGGNAASIFDYDSQPAAQSSHSHARSHASHPAAPAYSAIHQAVLRFFTANGELLHVMAQCSMKCVLLFCNGMRAVCDCSHLCVAAVLFCLHVHFLLAGYSSRTQLESYVEQLYETADADTVHRYSIADIREQINEEIK